MGIDVFIVVGIVVFGLVYLIGVLCLLFNEQAKRNNIEIRTHRKEIALDIQRECAELFPDNDARFTQCVENAENDVRDDAGITSPVSGETFSTGLVKTATTGIQLLGSLAGVGGIERLNDDIQHAFATMQNQKIEAAKRAARRREREKKQKKYIVGAAVVVGAALVLKK